MIDTDNRKKLIREVLDYDKEVNQRVLNLEKQQVQKWGPEEVQPFIQVDEDAESQAKELVVQLRVILERKAAGLEPTLVSAEATREVCAIEEVLITYNKLAGLFVEPRNTQQTKIVIKDATNAMDDVVKEILYGLSRLMPSGRRKLLRAYNLYDTIKNQLQTGNIKPITEDDLNANVMRIIRNHPDWRPRGRPVYYDMAGEDDDDDDDDDRGGPPPPDALEPSPETPRPPSSRDASPPPPPPPEPRRRARMRRKQPPNLHHPSPNFCQSHRQRRLRFYLSLNPRAEAEAEVRR